MHHSTYCLYPLSFSKICPSYAAGLTRHKSKCLTSYWVIRPFGSTGSSHFRKIMSSSGVKVSDSGAMPPGTTRNWRDKHLSVKIEVLIPERAPSCQYRKKKNKKKNEMSGTAARNRELHEPLRRQIERAVPAPLEEGNLIYELHQLCKRNTDGRKTI